jgi:hypothetical protein
VRRGSGLRRRQRAEAAMAAGGVRAEPERGEEERRCREMRDVRQGVAAGSRHEGSVSFTRTCHYERCRLHTCHKKVLSYLCAMHLKFVYVCAIPSIS